MNMFKVSMNILNLLKPYIRKVFPDSFLRKARRIYIKWNTAKLKKENIKPFKKELYADGINLIGNIRGDFGLGQSCRLVAWELQGSKIPFGIYEHHTSNDLHMSDCSCDLFLKNELEYNINLIHINASDFTLAYYQLGKKVWDYRYNIAFWLWELEEFPDEWVGCIDIVDEIWTPSEFVSAAIRKKTEKPVITIPYYVEAPIEIGYDRKYFHLPEDKFLFLMMYDSNSVMERKNPIGVLQAFKQAFTRENQKVGLVIKLNGKNKKDIDYITRYLDGYKNVYFMTDVLSKVEVNSLVADADVYVSMHRAEGFGLVMAEAMLNGTPCIATNWSANTEFMNSDAACMLDYKLVQIKKDIGPFRKGNYWAEPDVNQAADYMKYLYKDKDFYHTISKNAKLYANKVFDLEKIREQIQKRLSEIYHGNKYFS